MYCMVQNKNYKKNNYKKIIKDKLKHIKNVKSLSKNQFPSDSTNQKWLAAFHPQKVAARHL